MLMLLAALLGNGKGNAADAWSGLWPSPFSRKRKGHDAEDAATDGEVKGP